MYIILRIDLLIIFIYIILLLLLIKYQPYFTENWPNTSNADMVLKTFYTF